MDPVRTLEKVVSFSANAVWPLMQRVSRMGPAAAPFHPKWSDQSIPRGAERTSPPLGWPRETDSLCPTCVKEVRTAILDGRAEVRTLVEGRPGEVRASIE